LILPVPGIGHNMVMMAYYIQNEYPKITIFCKGVIGSEGLEDRSNKDCGLKTKNLLELGPIESDNS